MCWKAWPFLFTKGNGKDQPGVENIQHGLKEKNLISRTDANFAVKTSIVTTITIIM